VLKEHEKELVEAVLTRYGSHELLKLVLQHILKDNDMSLQEVLQVVQQVTLEISIPLSIFTKKLRPMEAICKYLRENHAKSNKEVAILLNRDVKSCWANYARAHKKVSQKYTFSKNQIHIPITLFASRQFSILENIILYLTTNYRLSTKQIGKLLGNSPNSVAVLLKRAKEKHEE
jgi:DNA-binding CsgD family transcriptional regulator